MSESVGQVSSARVVIYSTRGNSGFAFAVGLFLGGLGLHFVLHGAQETFFSWILIVVGVGWLFYGVGELTRKTPRLTLDKQGLTTDKDVRIGWSEIRTVGFGERDRTLRLELVNGKTETVSLAKVSMHPKQVVDAVKQLSEAAGAAVGGAPADSSAEIVSSAEYLKALELLQHSKYTDAVDAFTLVVDLNPTNHVSYRGRGLARMGAGDTQGALEDLDKAVELGPTDPDNYVCRAEIRAVRGDKLGAEEDRERATHLRQ